jgi:hypothetical protein
MISRRKLLVGSSALAAYTILSARRAMAANGTIPGAIRWDAWYGGGSGSEANVNAQVSASLGPTVFQNRAPWFAAPVSPFLNSINGNQQALMDAEIAYAASAGLKYWAYCWYGQQTPASPFMNAWNLHQSSSVKNNMNWCLLLQFTRISSAIMAANQATYVSYFQQANYQTVSVGTANRPLVYIFMDTTSFASFGGTTAGVATAITNLRAACATAGIGNPYVVVMYGTPSQAASWATSFALMRSAITRQVARTHSIPRRGQHSRPQLKHIGLPWLQLQRPSYPFVWWDWISVLASCTHRHSSALSLMSIWRTMWFPPRPRS